MSSGVNDGAGRDRADGAAVRCADRDCRSATDVAAAGVSVALKVAPPGDPVRGDCCAADGPAAPESWAPGAWSASSTKPPAATAAVSAPPAINARPARDGSRWGSLPTRGGPG